MANDENEDQLLRSTALQNAASILAARQRAEQELLRANEALAAKSEELALSLSMIRATLESTTDGILVTDAEGRVTDYNENFLGIWRISGGTLRTRDHLIVQQTTAQQLKSPVHYFDRIAEIYASQPAETSDMLECADGRSIERRSKIQRIEGRNVGRVWSFRDVTDKQRAEEGLYRLAAIVESSDDAIISKTLEGIITTWNAGAQRLFGYTAGEMIGQPVILLLPPDRVNEEPAILDRLKRGERIEHYETVRRRKDGTLRNVSLTVSPVKDSSGKIIGASKIARDITDRIRAEREIREQSEWFGVTLASIGDAVITADTQCRITFLNAAAEKLTGWSASEAVGRAVSDVMRILHETTREPAANPIDRALAEGIIVGLANHTILIRRDGSELPVEDSAAPIKNPAGQTIGAVMVFHDVSERRQKENALAQSEERYRLIGQVVPHILWTADKDGKPEYLNERWYTYTGQDASTPANARRAGALHPDDVNPALTAWERAVQSGEAFETEYRLRRYDGQYRWFIARAVPLRDQSGKIIRWYGSSTDIHQQKLTAEALREQYSVTEQLNDVARALATELDLAKVVQIITDAGTRITRAQFGAFFYNVLDEKGASYTLYTLSGVPRSAFEKFPMPRATQLFGPTFRGEGVIRIDDVRKDSRFGKNPPHHGMPAGHLPVVSYLAVPVFSRTGEVLGGLFFGHPEPAVFTERDETIIVGIAAQAAAAMDIARSYQEEQRARAAAELANKTKDHFLAALSHELRTPLTPVLAILSELRDENAIPPAIADDLETVRRNVELEARLIDDLLDLTRVTRGKLELHCEPVPIGPLLENAINTCLAELKAKQLTLVREFSVGDRTIIADSARLTQILWNLLKNSIKFTPEGGRITLRAFVTSPPGGEQLVIEIQDTGMGIEPEFLGKVFDAFEQGSRKITQQFGGLGLGLAISKAIAESHQGTIVALSEGIDKGSTFTLTVPFDGCEKSTGSRAVNSPLEFQNSRDIALPPARSAPGTPVRTLRILLVEDHADTAAIVSRVLRRMGHTVFHASRIRTALELAEKEIAAGGIDLVMSDLGLPDGSGLTLMRELSTKHGLRGIALSGFGMESDVQQSKAAGFSHHLIKPVNLAVLRTTIAEMVQGN